MCGLPFCEVMTTPALVIAMMSGFTVRSRIMGALQLRETLKRCRLPRARRGSDAASHAARQRDSQRPAHERDRRLDISHYERSLLFDADRHLARLTRTRIVAQHDFDQVRAGDVRGEVEVLRGRHSDCVRQH